MTEPEQRCMCDDFCDSPCPAHWRENELQNRALAAEARLAELEIERDNWRDTSCAWRDVVNDMRQAADLARAIGKARAKHKALFYAHQQALRDGGDWVSTGSASADAERDMMTLLDQAAALGNKS